MPQICCYYWCILEVKVYVEVHKWILSIQKMVCEEYSLFFQFFFFLECLPILKRHYP